MGDKKWSLHAKAAADYVLSAAAVVILSPVLAVIALLIKADSSGPVFYRETRIGRAGVPFHIFKFRTMIAGAEFVGRGRAVARDDERITRVGQWLRRTSLDEVPQILNVVLGHMSLVGPRPTVPHQVERYTAHQRRRLEAKPGMTGWAQVNGRNSLSWEDRIELDIWYIDHWSLWLDLRIVAKTPRALLDSEGLYGPTGVTTDLGELPSGGANGIASNSSSEK